MYKTAFNIAKQTISSKIGYPLRPTYAVFVVTKRCNMMCPMCGILKENGDNDLDIDNYQRVFSSGLRSLDVVKITGGEPFIRTDSSKLLSYLCKEANASIFHVTTNGYYTDRINDFLNQIRGKRVSLSISLDGDEATHDRIRGVTGAFRQAKETISMIKRDHPLVKVTVNCTISDLNHDTYQRLGRSIQDIGVDQLVYFIADSNQNYTDSMGLKRTVGMPDESLDEHQKKIQMDVRQQNMKHSLSYRLTNGYYLSGLKSGKEKRSVRSSHRCMALWSYFRMMPNGDIVMCVTKPLVIGNIKEKGFDEIWFGERAKKARKIVSQCQDCWKECEVIPSCIYSGNLARYLFFRR